MLWRLPGDELVAAVAALPLTHEVVFDALVEGVDHTGEPAALRAAGSQAVLHQSRPGRRPVRVLLSTQNGREDHSEGVWAVVILEESLACDDGSEGAFHAG